MGEIYEKKLKDNLEAVSNYEIVANNYSDNKNAIESLWRIAEIYEDDKKYEDAINYYNKIVTK